MNAPGFQVEGDNTASLPLNFTIEEETGSDLIIPHAARFSLLALRPGPATVSVDLYRELTFEATLKAEVQVTKIQASELPKPSLLIRPRPVLLPDFMLQVSTELNEFALKCTFHYTFSSLHSSFLPESESQIPIRSGYRDDGLIKSRPC